MRCMKWVIGLALTASLAIGASYDVIIRGGAVYDGSGSPPITADVAISGDTIRSVGDLSRDKGRVEVGERDGGGAGVYQCLELGE